MTTALDRPGLTRRSLIGAAATAAVAGTTMAKLVQRSGLDGYQPRGGFGLVVAQHELRVDHGRLTDIVAAQLRDGGIPPFVTLGFSVPEDVDQSLLEQATMRTRGADGWSDWNPVPFAPEEAPDGPEAAASRRFASQPYWVGFADGFEVELPAGLADRCVVHLVRETPVVLGHHDDTIDASVSFAPEPPILPRTSWSARAPKYTPSYAASLSMAVVHHTVDRNGYSVGEVPGIIAATQRYHMDVRGWNDIAYNFMIDRFGQIWEARAGGVTQLPIGGHAAGFNTGTTGMCAIGDYHFLSGSYTRGVPPTPEMLLAYESLLAWKLGLHGVDPTTTVTYRAGTGSSSSRYPAGTTGTFPRVVGHTDVGATACPGSLLHPKLPSLQQAAAAKQVGYADVPQDAPFAAAVAWMIAAGVVPQPGSGQLFRPANAMSRRHLVVWLWRFMGSPTGHPPHDFVGAPRSATYEEPVRWARAIGLFDGVIGTDRRFRPKSKLTRLQFARILWNLTGRRTGYPPSRYQDVATGNDYGVAVQWADATGVMAPVTKPPRFRPKRDVSRAQAARCLFQVARKSEAWTTAARTPTPTAARF